MFGGSHEDYLDEPVVSRDWLLLIHAALKEVESDAVSQSQRGVKK